MPQNESYFALNFATFCQCAIIPLKSKSQTASVNALLIKPRATDISTAACSNYTTGKRTVPDDYRFALATLSEAELTARLNYIGILEYDRMCEALLCLVKCAKIPVSQRNRLIDTYYNSEQIEFIKSTIKAAANCKEVIPLSNTDIDNLADFANVKSVSVPTYESCTTTTQPETTTDKTANCLLTEQKSAYKYDHHWIKEYTSQITEDFKSGEFFGVAVVSTQQDLHMPYDFPKLLSLLTPMVKGCPIDDFSIDEFLDLMSISKSNYNVTTGSLEYLKISGPASGVVKFITRYDLSEVSDAVFLMAGKVTNRDAKNIEDAIRTASNQNVNCIHAMWYDEEISEIEVTLITHIYPAEAHRQLSYTIDSDGVKIPSVHQKNDMD